MNPNLVRRLRPAALLAVAFALPLLGRGPVSAQAGHRPGITMRFVQIGGGTGGVEGRAYLPAVPANVTVSDGPGSCAGGRWIELTARARTGHVREMHVTINATSPGVIRLDAQGPCPSATIEATLEDGTALRSNDGNITVRELHPGHNPLVVAGFSWSPMVDGHPMPFRGEIVIPAPSH